jgi:hypothetical protein
MKEHPILFSSPMVKAIIEGRKTQTRRVIKPQPYGVLGKVRLRGKGVRGFFSDLAEFCPYGAPGDRLWVRETFCHKVDQITAKISETEFWYRATNPEVIKVDGDGAWEFRKDGNESSPWKPSIHMPRKASRITLEIIGVRVQRLQEITEEDARAEGVTPTIGQINCERLWSECRPDLPKITAVQQAFSELWDSINAKRGFGWDSNPWVWCLTFKRI